jgi:hypothetical protein
VTRNTKLRLARASALATLSTLLVVALDRIGVGPNVGFRSATTAASIASSRASRPTPSSRSCRSRCTATRRSRTPSSRCELRDDEIRLCFEGAATRAFEELLQKLERVGVRRDA